MARRPTIRDVAAAAGLSQATVDRVLNGREAVREETARKVYEAARRIGYHAAPLIAQRLQADVPELRLGVVLHKERQAFYQAFARELEAAARRAAGVRVRLQVEFSASQAPADFIRLIEGFRGRADAVAASAVTHPDITEAVPALKARGGAGLRAPQRLRARGPRRTTSASTTSRSGASRRSVIAHGGAPAGQARGVRRRLPLARPRAARGGVPQLLPRARAAVPRSSTRW